MPQILMSNAKGVVQSSGSGLILEAAEALDAAAADLHTKTLTVTHPYHRFVSTGAGKSFSLPSSSSSLTVGQLLLLSHVGVEAGVNDNTFTVTEVCVLDSGESVMLVWTGSAWAKTSQTLA